MKQEVNALIISVNTSCQFLQNKREQQRSQRVLLLLLLLDMYNTRKMTTKLNQLTQNIHIKIKIIIIIIMISIALAQCTNMLGEEVLDRGRTQIYNVHNTQQEMFRSKLGLYLLSGVTVSVSLFKTGNPPSYLIVDSSPLVIYLTMTQNFSLLLAAALLPPVAAMDKLSSWCKLKVLFIISGVCRIWEGGFPQGIPTHSARRYGGVL